MKTKFWLTVYGLMAFSACESGAPQKETDNVLDNVLKSENRVGEESSEKRVFGLRGSSPEAFGWTKMRDNSYHYVGSKHPDFIIPSRSQIMMQRVVVPRASYSDAEICLDCDGTLVNYISFEGNTHSLRQYKGKFVRLLLPESWATEEGALTDDERRSLLTRSDMLYQMYKEVLGREPSGSGLTNIAVVPDTCGWGCGYVGAKGVEMLDESWALELIKEEISGGAPTNGVVLHELGHNFDVYSNYLHYNNNGAHGWTRFMDVFMRLYGRAPNTDCAPEEQFEIALRETFDMYFAKPTANWEDCVRDSLCEDTLGLDAEQAYGGINLRYISLHGVESLLNAFDFMNDYASANSAPTTAEGKADLHIRMLAEGAGVNLGCYIDTWNWYASNDLRSEMDLLFGTGNTNCLDVDGDGYSVAQGDCDDSNSSANPAEEETANGVDDDCDGMVDDFKYTEPLGGDFTNPTPVSRPAEIEGTITESDSDFFTFDISSPQSITITLRSVSDFAGWVFVYDASGNWYDYQHCGAGSTSSKRYDLDEARQWRIGVELNSSSNPGDYTVIIDDAITLPLDAFGDTAEPAAVGDDLVLSVDTHTLSQPVVLDTPTDIRFWVTGVGVVGAIPYSASATLTWTPENLADGLYGYSAQLLAGTKPVSDFTPIEYFTIGDPGDDCNESNAIDMGTNDTPITVDNNACLMVRDAYPTWWGTRTMQLQNPSGGGYPISMDWINSCAGASGNETFTGDWQTKFISPTDDDCATIIKLNGDGAETITLVYYG